MNLARWRPVWYESHQPEIAGPFPLHCPLPPEQTFSDMEIIPTHNSMFSTLDQLPVREPRVGRFRGRYFSRRYFL
jgi:hypothetical protein